MVLELVLAHSRRTAIYITHLDAYSTGFEFEIRAVAAEEQYFDDLFGRHWPTVGDRRDQLPPELLRVGVQFADGRKATSISGPPYPGDAPSAPVMWALGGGGGGGIWRQGYWVWPLPPAGELEFVCEWPAAGISLTRRQIDAQLILDAARRSSRLFPETNTEPHDV